MKTIKSGLVAAALFFSGCAANKPTIQTFTELVRSPRPHEYATMQVPLSNGNATAELYYTPEGYTLSLDNPFFIHTEKYGNSLIYKSPSVSYHDYDCDGHVDVMAINGIVTDVNSRDVDNEYRNALSSIRQERVGRVWRYRWR